MYLLRLDDASEYMALEKWNRIEALCNKYNIKPIVGIIPKCEDRKLTSSAPFYPQAWEIFQRYQKEGYCIALHGFSHVFETDKGGINPVNKRSEFAGVSLTRQKQKIQDGIHVLQDHGIKPRLFFAPAHTFDENTIHALKACSDIRIISDTIANDIYNKDGITYIPLQSNRVRPLRFRMVTFCYHPNEMSEKDFKNLESFIMENEQKFTSIDSIDFSCCRALSLYDRLLRFIYYFRRVFIKHP